METELLRFRKKGVEGYWKMQSSVLFDRFKHAVSTFVVVLLGVELPGVELLGVLQSKPVRSLYPEYFLNGLLGIW